MPSAVELRVEGEVVPTVEGGMVAVEATEVVEDTKNLYHRIYKRCRAYYSAPFLFA